MREAVKLAEQEAKARIVDLRTEDGGHLRLGMIDLPSFYADMGETADAASRSATADVARLLGKLKAEHVRGLILDLRQNGGGSLQEAVSLTGLFVRKGPVVQPRDQAGSLVVDRDDDPAVAYGGPLVVLTSRFSASSSEILTGALQDYGRALVVGDSSTFGKGTVQNVLPLSRIMDRAGLAHAYDPGALKITTSKFYRPSGASTQLRGVASDIVLPSTSDVSEVSEAALKSPLPWDAVPAAPHEQWNLVRPYVSELREKSQRRVAEDKRFHELADDIERLKRRLTSKSVSMNEAERRAELAEGKARRKERQQEERDLEVSQNTSYSITLENLSRPGLPAPLATPGGGVSSAQANAAHENESSAKGDVVGDVVLDESMRILTDYVGMLSGGDGDARNAAR